MNRYEQARRTLRDRHQIMADFRAVLSGPVTASGKTCTSTILRIPTSGPQLCCLASVDDVGDGSIEEHVSVSYGRGARKVPSWDDLVLVRALAWDDDVEVFQVFPPLAGPRAEEWVSLGGVEVLHLRRKRDR